MGIIRKPQSIRGQIFLLVVILVDIGLLIWGWHIYQRRQEKLDDSGFNLSKAPEKEKNPFDYNPGSDDVKDLEASMRLVIKESRNLPALGQGRGGAPPVQSGERESSRRSDSPPPPIHKTSSRSMNDASAEERRKVKKAKSAFYDLKKDPKFKNSKAIKDWNKEFLSHKDLRKINAAYQKDRDAIKFMVKMVGSSNFRGMFGKYMLRADMRDFVQTMAKSAAVNAAADTFLADANMGAMAKHLGFARDRMTGKNPAKEDVSALNGLRGSEDYKGMLNE